MTMVHPLFILSEKRTNDIIVRRIRKLNENTKCIMINTSKENKISKKG